MVPGVFADRIDKRLAKAIGASEIKRLQVHRKELPSYRFVDLYRAVERFLEADPTSEQIVSDHSHEPLHRITHSEIGPFGMRKIKRSPNVAWPVSAREETFLPTDSFWLTSLPRDASRPTGIVRLTYLVFSEQAILEVAAADGDWLADAVHRIQRDSVSNSIYRDATIEVAFESASRDEYGDVERAERLRVVFKDLQPVADEDLVVDDETRRLLQRNVIDLHERREQLKAHGVPVRRGVLLYGPPGTGKTFACRYVCGRLRGVTRILVTGTALGQVGAIFRLARMLQPALLILEDVDLVFTTREVNLYSSVLGDLLDQMDGLRPFEDISFLLTTNAIDRLEAAVRDRPGRISQLVHFQAPNLRLRARYLAKYLQPYGVTSFTAEDLAAMSDGATQAFLKEWVHRAVQIATERLGAGEGALDLRLSDFEEALAEMKQHASGDSARIIGFHR